MTRRKHSRPARDIAPVHPHAAAVDIGATLHVAAVRPGCDPEPVRTFGTFTTDLHRLADWFEQCGVETVAMESTGIYWIPLYEILDQRGFEGVVVNARAAKHVPGRKTDVSDAAWLQRLHEYGLLRASFRPAGAIATLRSYLRQRERLLDQAAAHIQHMQKALTEMNLQLHHVVADVTGVTGLRILRALVAGERDPDTLAAYSDPRCKASAETLRAALVGNYREEHVFALAQALELYDIYQAKVAACDQRIEAVLERLKAATPPPAAALPPARPRRRQANEPGFAVREALHAILGADPTQIDGIWPVPGAHAGGRVRDGPLGLAERQALHLLAEPGAAQKNLRRQGAVGAHPPLRQPGRGAAAAGGGGGWAHRDGPGGLLPPSGGAGGQGQGGHRDGAQDRRSLLQHAPPRHGLRRSGRLRLRGTLPAAGPEQSPTPGQVTRIRLAEGRSCLSCNSCFLVSVRKPDLEIIGFLSRRRRHLERSPSGTRLCSQPENANFLSEMFPDRHLVLLRHIWAGSERVPTEAAGTSLKAASQGCRKPPPHACDGVRHVALRPGRGRRAVDNRREGQTSRVGGLHAVLRGEASPARQQGTHKPRCTRWRGGGTRASCAPRSARAPVPA